MQRFDGHRSNSQLYVWENYVYSLNKRTRENTIYLICRNREFCPARVILNNGIPTLRQPHNHEADVAELQLLKLKTSLRKRAQQENTELETIFREEERRYPMGAALINGFESVRSTMYRSRRLGTPAIPNSMMQYAETIRQRQWFGRYGKDLHPEENDFFRGHITSADNSVSVLFMSETILQYVRQQAGIQLHMDATFKVVPRAGGAMQLFTIHLLYDDMTFPLLYALMERKTRAAYEAILQYLVRILGNTRVESVMADYETALRTAVVRTLGGNTRLRGCWFHYSRAVFKKAQELGLVRGNHEQTRKFIRAAMVLPLLPRQLLAEGVDTLQSIAQEHNINAATFINYLRRQWLPLQISVHGEYHRTNNSVEAFHRQLYRVMRRPHPNIWRFTAQLIHFEHSKTLDFIRLRTGVMRPHQRRRRYVHLDQRIRGAEERLGRDGNVRHFLLYMSYGVHRLEAVMNGMPDQIQPAATPPPAAPLHPGTPPPVAAPRPPLLRTPTPPPLPHPPTPPQAALRMPATPPPAAPLHPGTPPPVAARMPTPRPPLLRTPSPPPLPHPPTPPQAALRMPATPPPAAPLHPGTPPPVAARMPTPRPPLLRTPTPPPLPHPPTPPQAALRMPAPPSAVALQPETPPPPAVPGERVVYSLPPCVVCFTNTRQYLLLNCQHLCMCEDCVRQFRVRANEEDDSPSTRCPVCRSSILVEPVRVFIPF